jgi:hypothetical protein
MLDHTVSDGLVSSVRGAGEIRLLQISAPISEGSSGGPLLNRRGEVIGVASLIVSGGQNVNFAVPIEYLEPMLGSRGGESMRAFGLRTREREAASVVRGDAPTVAMPDELLAMCEEPSRRVIRSAVDDALRIATPLCNEGAYEACARIYDGAIVGLSSGMDIEGCERARVVLRDAHIDAKDALLREPAARATRLRDTLRALGRALDDAAAARIEGEQSAAGIGFSELAR